MQWALVAEGYLTCELRACLNINKNSINTPTQSTSQTLPQPSKGAAKPTFLWAYSINPRQTRGGKKPRIHYSSPPPSQNRAVVECSAGQKYAVASCRPLFSGNLETTATETLLRLLKYDKHSRTSMRLNLQTSNSDDELGHFLAGTRK